MLNVVALAAAALALLSSAAGILLAHLELIPAMAGMLFYGLGGLLGFTACALAVAVLFIKQNFAVALFALVGCIPLIAVTSSVLEALRVPRINDIATNLDDVPVFEHAQTLDANKGRNFGFPPENGDLIRKAYPELETLHLPIDVETVFIRAAAIARQRMPGWSVTVADSATGRIEAEVATRVLHFRDDVVIRIREDGAGGTLVDMRSKSREGKSDLGANARRIHTFFEALAAAAS